MIAPPQCRAARAYLQWTQQQLAEAAEVSTLTVYNLENDSAATTRANQNAIHNALEAAGIALTQDGGIEPRAPREGDPFAGQCRAGRAMLDWRQADLARRAGIATLTVQRVERGRTLPRRSTQDALREALHQAGVELQADGRVTATRPRP